MQNRTAWLAASITVAASAFLMIAAINPLWSRLGLHVPGEPGTRVNFTQAVDAVFYVWNAEFGYQWGSQHRLSIWFHPLLPWAINLLPPALPADQRLWLLSLLSGVVALGLVRPLLDHLSREPVDSWLICLAVILPGGLGIATGNPEFPCLVFTTALLLSVLGRGRYIFPFLWGGLAVLAKPNALYMVPVLAVYLIHGWRSRDRRLAINSLAGILGVLLVFLAWMLFVDSRSGEFGAYWAARKIAIVPLEFSFFERSLRSFLFIRDAALKLRFAGALLVPLVELSLALVVPFKRPVDRAAVIAGIAAVMVSTILLNNPNKVMNYLITLPAHSVTGLLFIRQAFRHEEAERAREGLLRKSAGIAYLSYCALMMVFFVLGTPLRWYY